MKTVCQTCFKSDRRGMSRTALLVGLLLWAAVFVSLYLMNNRQADPVDAESVVAGGESNQPIIVDKTNPDQASVSTVKLGFPARSLPDFNLLNSEGGTFGLEDLKGKRWVASFVFSRCASTCPMISGAMMQVHDRVKGKADNVMFVTITVDPKFDTPEVFQKYAENYRQGDSSRWKFLTGEQQEIFELIVKGFGLYVAENLGDDRMSGFEVAHTNRVVLVNEAAIPVGTFLGTRDEDMVKLRRILTGKADFPEPGPALTFGSPNGQPAGLSFELVPQDDDSGEASADDEDSGDATESGSGDGSGNAADDLNQQSSIQWTERQFYLTRATAFQDDDAALPGAGRATSDEEATAEKTTGHDSDPGQDDSEQTVAEFNESLQSRLPDWARALPALNAGLNSIATVLLLFGYAAIRRKNKSLHRNLMVSAFLMSVFFLISYLSYHYALGKYTGEHGRRFEGTGIWASIYPWVLWPHVVLAVFVPVLAFRVFQFAFREDWERHRRLARITFPIWLYVSVTGVAIYAMLYHWPTA